MSFLKRIFIVILANSLAIWLANWIVPGFVFRGEITDLFIAGAILGFVNALVKPLVKLLTCPIILLTLGLFTVIINIALLNLVASWLPTLSISGFWPAFWAVIIISLVNHIILSSSNQKNEKYSQPN